MLHVLESVLRPPASLIWLAAAGLILLRTRWRRAGVALASASVAGLYLLSTPLVVAAMMRTLDRYPPLDPEAVAPAAASAIVILSASQRDALEYGGVTASPAAFERVRYGVWLHRRLGFPILITGREGDVMAEAMERWYGTRARWVESESGNTHLHVVACAPLVRDAGIERIVLVTHYWHMPRAVASFGQLGVEIVPAPLALDRDDEDWYDPRWLLPGAAAFYTSAVVFHEWIGRAWYRLRYGY